MNSTPSYEAIKEFGRLILITILSYLLTEGVVAFVVDQVFGTNLDPIAKIQVVGFITFLLRAVDKWLHERGKENDIKGWLGTKGITGF